VDGNDPSPKNWLDGRFASISGLPDNGVGTFCFLKENFLELFGGYIAR